MGGGNGAKAAQARSRAAAKTSTTAKSQLKVNEAAKQIKCSVCFSTFMANMAQKQLSEHAENKHSKTYEECFGR